jgi:hypothetical protein
MHRAFQHRIEDNLPVLEIFVIALGFYRFEFA